MISLFALSIVDVLICAAVVALLFAAAPPLAEFIIRKRADRLPPDLSARLFEEWIAEVRSLDDRLSRLRFAVGLLTTRNKTLVEAADAGEAAALVAPFVDVSRDVTRLL